MWIWLRFVSSFNALRAIQKEFISHFENCKNQKIVGEVVSTYRGRIEAQGNLPILTGGNLYVCMDILGINENPATKEIELSRQELEKIPLDIRNVIGKLTQEFSLPIDYSGEGISDSTYDHLSIRNYRRALGNDRYKANLPSSWNTEDILELVSRGTDVGLKYHEEILSKNDVKELISLTRKMWNYIDSMNDLDIEQKQYCLHIAAHTIPKVWLGIKEGKPIGGFIDQLLQN